MPHRRLDVLLAAAVLPVAFLALVVPFLARPEVRLDFDEDAPARLPHTRGVHGAEHTGDFFTFAWTSQNARQMLPALPRGTAWTLTIAARAPRPGDAQAAPVAFSERGRELAVWASPPRESQPFGAFDVTLPASDASGLRLDIASGDSFTPGPPDNRTLALQVDAMVLRPENRWAAIPWGRAALFAAALAALAALVATATGSTVGGVAALAAALAIGGLGRRASWLYLPSMDDALGAAVPALAVLGVGLLFRWLWRLPRAEAGIAIALSVWFTVVKYALLVHPAMTIGDAAFHQNRFQLVYGGAWLFTSVAPGGEFPYPPAFYAGLRLLAPGHLVSVALMRGFALTTDAIAGLLLAFAVASPSRPLLTPAAALLWQTAPALFQVQALTYLTNAFGNAWSAIGLAFLARVLRDRAAIGWIAAAVAAIAIAFVAHLSSFVMLALTLGAAAGLAAIRRRWRTAGLVGGVLAVCLVSVWILYYRHFTPLYAQRWAHPVAAAPIDAGGSPPLQRDEAHQTAFVPGWPALQQRLAFVPRYAARYLGIGLLGLAVLLPLVWRRGAPPDEGDAPVLAWGALLATIAAFVAGQLTPIDLRYYLAGASLLAVLGAATVAATWAPSPETPRLSPAFRGVVALLAIVAVVQGCWYMARFLWYPLPR
jgi:hypothetical protein